MVMPIGHGSLGRVRENFARQFTPDGSGYVYRRGTRGPAIRLAAAERDDLVAEFNRGLTILVVVTVVGVIGGGSLLAAQPDLLPAALRPWQEAVLAGMTVIVVLVGWWHLNTAPDRAIGTRPPVAPALGKRERLRANMRGLDWSPLALGALLATGLIVRVAGFEREPLSAANIGCMALGIVLLMAFAGFAWLKYRMR
ncbi:hypothetical protein [uncultured Sphingomonas sp.]|uniref:hypothetical protein n=1 Tax=uncultured Sphingomonas sp. TaxID=158754 RepID=UPI0035CC8D08